MFPQHIKVSHTPSLLLFDYMYYYIYIITTNSIFYHSHNAPQFFTRMGIKQYKTPYKPNKTSAFQGFVRASFGKCSETLRKNGYFSEAYSKNSKTTPHEYWFLSTKNYILD